ncbi:MAG TPA: invasion associated locus B family protein [Hyphomicrobiaceae bacterium]
MKKAALVLRLFVSSICLMPLDAALAQEGVEMQSPTSLSETYEAWTVRCVNQQQGEKTQRVCQMAQTLLQQGSQQRVLTFALRRRDDTARATLVFPFGLLLSEGFRVEIAEEEVLRGTYRTCLPTGCIAEVEVPAETIEKLEAAETASVLMTATTGQQIRADISLKGFKAAYQRLVALAA